MVEKIEGIVGSSSSSSSSRCDGSKVAIASKNS